jgi:2-C-methyl-D-erythritol 4-phosphate cytidylyltransferase
MGSSLPKQFMSLGTKPIAAYSFDLFASLPEVCEIVVVCEAKYRNLFNIRDPAIQLKFGEPGPRRQDSVYNGFQQADTKAEFICVHDSARPFLSVEMIRRALEAASQVGAAAVGMPLKYTIKECESNGMVKHTPPRECFWEIQTPQIIRNHLLREGFEKAMERNLTVTDDLSLVELIPHPVKIVEGSGRNIKITTPEDLMMTAHWV